MEPEVNANLRRHRFFHATDREADLPDLAAQGFRCDWTDEDGRWLRDGNLGIGTYLTCDWKTALWFGNIVFEVTLQRGTKILDAAEPPDRRVLEYLRREFGQEVLNGDPRVMLPHNKRLTLGELTELLRYHYQRVWQKDWGRDREGFQRWRGKRLEHARALSACVSLLRRYGFHGYGDPASDNGILIFCPERILIERIAVHIPSERWWELDAKDGFKSWTWEQLRETFPPLITLAKLRQIAEDRKKPGEQ